MIGQRIKEARKRKGLSQTELAHRLCLKTQSIQQWESGKTAPRNARIEELATVLGVDVGWLYGADVNTGKVGADNDWYDEACRELVKVSSCIALARLQELGWLTINRTDIPVDAIADLFVSELSSQLKMQVK